MGSGLADWLNRHERWIREMEAVGLTRDAAMIAPARIWLTNVTH